ncbi:LysR family transcriptional regulator [Nesterenkonia sp. E16_7]|uniref:LysR family transcriptional regulator n=1 Tax=unclassified Nesterenkonia TaxID=2629769 RepID=UPI001A91E92F|nr:MULTISPECIES: LysR family transcriptional regulator [unclassified Nesterenkonia]MBO0595711.1 LysR family transcriptional regulator [Nesterenkonia sp. E16_10]MBO0600019.1 LysR family transcriptional regulator [Nesterenkonia sp. E16_7]
MQPPFELRVLRYFVSVAEELHFGHAAARLFITQPSLSVQIRNLERGLDTPLFNRTNRGVTLTPAGEVLLGHARELLSAADAAASLTRQAAQEPGQKLVVGFQANAAAELTQAALEAYRHNYPGVQVEMRSYPFRDPTAGLADGSADVAFVRPPLPEFKDLRMATLFEEPRVLAVSEASELATRSSIKVEELLEEPFIARKAPEVWRDFWLATDARHNQSPVIGSEASTVDECFEAILSRRGVAFTQSSTQRFYSRPGLAFVPVTDLSPSTVSVAWRHDNEHWAARAFIETTQFTALSAPPPHTTLVT